MKPKNLCANSVRPWWREPMVWLVIGGPAVVVVAAVVTSIMAWQGADPPVQATPASVTPTDRALQPALAARNHAATPR